MTDFLTRLAGRTFGLIPVAQPIIASRFAPEATSPESTLWSSVSLELPASVSAERLPALNVLPLTIEEAESMPSTNLEPFLSERADSTVPGPFKQTNDLKRADPPSSLVSHSFESVVHTEEAQMSSLDFSEPANLLSSHENAYNPLAEPSSFSDTLSPLASTYVEPSTPTLSTIKVLDAPTPFFDPFHRTMATERADAEVSPVSSSPMYLPDNSLQLVREKGDNSLFSGEIQAVSVEASGSSFLDSGAQAISAGVNRPIVPQQAPMTPKISLNLSNLPNPEYPSVTIDERIYPLVSDQTSQPSQASNISLNVQNPANLVSSLSLVNAKDQNKTLSPPPQEEVEKAFSTIPQAFPPHANNIRKEQQSIEIARESSLFLPEETFSPSLANVSTLEGSSRKEASLEISSSIAPIVRITIGRIDVRAIAASSPPASVPKASKSSVSGPSLEQYLKQGKGGAR